MILSIREKIVSNQNIHSRTNLGSVMHYLLAERKEEVV